MNISNFSINDFSVEFKDNIIIITKDNGVVRNDLDYVKDVVETSMNKQYNYFLYRDPLGYYHCWDYSNNDSIYCTTINKTRAIEFITKHIKNETKNSSD